MTTHCQFAKVVVGAICHCTHSEASALHGTKPAVTVCLSRCQFRQTTDAQPQSRRVRGPGSILAGLFQTLGFKRDGGCGCAEMQVKMDAWGVEGCREHQDEILDFLEAKAKAQGILFARIAARVALETAIIKAKGLTEESRHTIDPVRRNAG